MGSTQDRCCPVCGGSATGRVAAAHYYCWDCCLEIVVTSNYVRVFHIEEDGSLTQVREERRGTDVAAVAGGESAGRR